MYTERAILKHLAYILRPVIAFILRHGVKLDEFLELAKRLLLEIAEEQLQKKPGPISENRLSLMTGLHRKDVARLRRKGAEQPKRVNAVLRIIGQWQQDKRFSTKSGGGRDLSFDGLESEFSALVASVSRELNPYSVLVELERIGAVKRKKKKIILTSKVYNPSADADQGFEMLGADSNDLIQAVEENLFLAKKVPNLHIKTEYDRIPSDKAAELRAWLLKEGSDFHEKMNNFLSKFDRDINKDITGSAGNIRVAIGAFSRVESILEENKDT